LFCQDVKKFFLNVSSLPFQSQSASLPINDSWLFSLIWQNGRRDSEDCVAAGPVWQHGRHNLCPARHCGQQGSKVSVAVQTAWQRGWHGNTAGVTHSWKMVSKAAGSAWQCGLHGSGAGVITRPARHAAGEALWLARQQGQRDSEDCMAAGPARQHDRCDTWPARHCGRQGNRAGVAARTAWQRGRRGYVVDEVAGSVWHQSWGVVGARSTTESFCS
jgi:hypothetical protein